MFVRDIFHLGESKTTLQPRLNIVPEGKDRRVSDSFRILKVVNADESETLDVRYALNRSRVLIIRIHIREFRESFDGLGSLGDGVDDLSAPDVIQGHGFEVEAGDDAEVIGSAFQGLEEVGVFLGIGVDGLGGGEDDLEVLDVVADEAVAGGEVGETSWI